MSNSKKLVYTGFEIVDIAALVKGASTGEGLGNRFLGSLRDCDAILFVLRAFDDPSVPGDTDPKSDLDTLELELVLADLASVEGRLYRQQRARRRATSRWPPRSPRSSGRRRSSATASRSTAPTSPPTSARCSRPRFLLTNKPVLVVVNIGEDQLDDGRRRWSRRSSDGDDALAVCLQLEAEAAAARSRGARRAARRPRARRGRRAPRRPRRVPPARPAHVPHHRRHRVAGVDVPRRRQGARVRGRDPLRPAAWLHPGRGDRLATSCSRSARGRRPRSRASCASRGRTTRSSTATCSRSASTCDGPDDAWLVRDGEVLAAAEVAATRARPAARPAAAATRSTARSCSARAATCTPSGMRFPIDVAFCDAERHRCCAPCSLRAVAALAGRAPRRVRDRGRGGRVRPLAARAPATGVELTRMTRASTGRRARARRDADRQPRRPLAASGRGAARRRRDRGRGHAPHARAAHARRHARGGPAARGARAQRAAERGAGRRRGARRLARRLRHRRGHARHLRSRRAARARAASTPGSRSRSCPVRARCSPRSCSRASRPTGSCSRGSCPAAASRGASASPRSPREARTTVLFEAPKRVLATLTDLLAACGPLREVAVARELTKLHEEVWRGTLAEAVGHVGAHRAARRARDRARAGAATARGQRRRGRRARRRPRSPTVCRPATPPPASPATSGCRAAAPTTPPCASSTPPLTLASRARIRTSDATGNRVDGTMPAPVLRDDADLLRERRAPHRARVHDGRGRRAGPLAAPLGRRRRVPHRHRRARPQDPAGRRGARRHARRSGPTATSALFRAPRGTASTSPTTTSSAPPSPGTSRAVQEFLQRVYDTGDIELDTYEGLYCVACELYYTEDELVDGRLPDPRHRRSSASPRRTTSSGSRATRTACSPTTPSIPRRCSRRASATRCSASSSRVCSTSR